MSDSLAIDIGSTSTVVAFQNQHHRSPDIINIPFISSSESCIIPSMLWVNNKDDRNPIIGEQVLKENLDLLKSPSCHRNFKRLIGSSNVSSGLSFPNESILSPEEAGELLLLKIWTHLPKNISPNRLILTAPVDGKTRYKNYRRWLLSATAALDVSEIALVDEPTAAAIGAKLSPGSTVLVIDLGGSTIDIALVKLQGGEGRAAPLPQLLHFGGHALSKNNQQVSCAEVISKAGLPLGGRDIDFWIASKIAPEFAIDSRLLRSAERVKCKLSLNKSAVDLDFSNETSGSQELFLDRQILDDLLTEKGLLKALDRLLERVLATGQQHGLRASQIDAILPIGGTARIPTIQRWLQKRCGYWPLLDEHPIEAVARGALSLVPDLNLKDNLTRGVSLRCWNQRSGHHNWYPLFVAGQSWPTSVMLNVNLACGENDQKEITLEFGEPAIEEQLEIVFREELPELQPNINQNNTVKPWLTTPLRIHLDPPGKLCEDRLQLSFGITSTGQIIMKGKDLINQRIMGPFPLGLVR